MAERRDLRFQSLAEIMPEVDRLLRAGYDQAGQWSLGQVCSHLSGTFLASVEGMPFRAPWLVRATLGSLLKRQVFKQGRLPGRTKLPAKLAPRPDLDDRAEAEGLRAAVGIFQRQTGPVSIHPFFGTMTRDDWLRFHAIHSAHHLGHLVPRPVGENPPR